MNKHYYIWIGLLIIATIAIGWYFFASTKLEPQLEAEINFSRDGNITLNNPGQKLDTWYLIYEEPGKSGLSAELVFDKINRPDLFQGQRVHVEGVSDGSKVSVRIISPIDLEGTNMTIKLYYYNPALDQGPGGVQCTKKGLVSVERIVPKTTTPLTDAIKLLLRGEISEGEKTQGVTSEFPLLSFSLVSASIQDGVATLTFADPENKTVGGSCRVAILWAQIEATAKQFSSVESVRFLPEELFQP